MPAFALQILDVYPDFDGFTGIMLAGLVTESGDLAVGDPLWVPTREGMIRSRVSGFPLIRWTEERRGWEGLTVDGVLAADVLVGEVATNEHPDSE